ncbi:cytochrome b/b6 domain-containing protein [soil metagenome]
MSPEAPTFTLFARIWDLPVRLFHWLLVALLGFSWWSGDQHQMDWHRRSGYCILALLVFRIYWGFAGGRTARFTQFVRGPRAAFTYARSVATGAHASTPGHNPLGGWSVVVMLGTLVAMVLAGLFAVDVDGLESGPLSDYVSFDQGRIAAELHGFVFNLLLALVALHVVAILFYLVRLRTNLIGPMVTGRRPARDGESLQGLGASRWKAALGIVLAALVAVAVSRGFRL